MSTTEVKLGRCYRDLNAILRTIGKRRVPEPTNRERVEIARLRYNIRSLKRTGAEVDRTELAAMFPFPEEEAPTP